MVERRVLVQKIDLDTCGAALFLGVTRKDKVEVLRSGQATPEDLADPNVVCIEVGGSGQTHLNNWDHHGPEAKFLGSATLQAGFNALRKGRRGLREKPGSLSLLHLSDYINILDLNGPEALRKDMEVVGKSIPAFPNLSDVFTGMLLVTRDPVEQLHRGIEIFQKVVRRGIDSMGRMPIEEIPEWIAYTEAKTENNRQVAEAVKKAERGITTSGLKLAWVETDFFGAPGALYGVGVQVVVAFSPHFGPAGVPKFTIAGNGIKVDAVLPELNVRELGWGGPSTGTILGSPREGSCMTLNEVVEIVRKNL